MTLFDDKPSDLPEQESSLPPAAEPLPAEDPNFRLAGDPISYAASTPSSYTPRPSLPEDLRISWSWTHFSVFIFFPVSSFFLVHPPLIRYFPPPPTIHPKHLHPILLTT